MLPVATFFLGAVVTIVAVLQWRVARNKLRLDLFDRRYKVYEATLGFFRQCVQESTDVDQHLSALNDETSNAEFLFGTDVVNYLDDIRKRAQNEHEGAAISFSDPDRITETTETFAPYLGFANVVTPTVRHMNEKRKILTLVALALVRLLSD